MQIKQFIQLAKSGALKEVTVSKGVEGYSIIAVTENTTEIIRTQLGHPRIFKNWETLTSRLDDAEIKNFRVIG